jgi:hypothetical protein
MNTSVGEALFRDGAELTSVDPSGDRGSTERPTEGRVPPEVTELGEIPVRDLPQPQVICDMTGLSGHCIRLIRGGARSSGSMPASYGS